MKNVSLALAVSAMAACLFMGAAYGDGTTESFGGVEYTYAVTNDEATITSIGNPLPDDLVLPGTLGGKPVVAIKRDVFPSYGYGYPNLKSIVFPDSLREIAEDNLANCPSLTNVTFGTGMEVLGYDVFTDKTRVAQFTVPDGNPNFSAEGGVLYSKDKTTLVRYAESSTTFDIPDTVTVVGEGAFYYRDLVGVTFPAGLKEIRDYAFACNFGLDIPALPSGLTVIGEAAFRSCFEITSVAIPDGVTQISSEAFNYCEKLSSLTIGSGVGDIGETAFGNCFALGKVVIPPSVTNIQGKAFMGCTNLSDVTIGSGVAIMGTLRAGAADEWGYVLESEPAFGACLSLMNFKLAAGNATFEEIGGCLYFRNTPKTAKKLASYPSGRGTLYFTGDVNVTELGEASCSRCDNFVDITIPASVREIGPQSMINCVGLSKLTIPSGPVNISNGAFMMNPYLYDVEIAGSVKTIGDMAFMHDFMPWDDADGRLVLHEGIETIGDAAFARSMNGVLREVVVPDSVTSLGIGAFANAFNLESVVLGSGVTALPESVFSGGSSLTNFIAKGTLTSVGAYAFESCYSLDCIALANAVEIGAHAFDNCYGLRNVDLYAPLEKISSNAFDGCSSLNTVVVPPNVTAIGDEAFDGCTGLTKAYLPKALEDKIDTASIFSNCTGLGADGIVFYGADEWDELAPELPEPPEPPEPLDPFTAAGLAAEYLLPSGVAPDLSGIFASVIGDGWKVAVSGLPTGLSYNATKATITGAAKNEGTTPATKGSGKTAEKEIATATFEVAFPTLTVEVAAYGADASATNKVKVAGGGKYAAGTKATLKATPATGSVFAGWYDADGKPIEGAADYRTASFPYVTTDADVTLVAKFATVAEDTASLTVNFGTEYTTEKDGTYELALGPLVESVTVPKLTVTGLPTGLTYDAKTLKIGGKATKPGVYPVKVQATNTSVKKATDATTGEFTIKVPNFTTPTFAAAGLDTDGKYVLSAGAAPDLSGVFAELADGGWKLAVSGLPAGLKYDAAKGLTGVATKEGVYTVTFTATKGSGKMAEKEIATATFEVAFPTLTLEVAAYGADASATNKVKVAGGGKYAAGTKATLKATPATGSVFAGWYDADGNPLEGAADYRTASFPYVTTDADVTLVAKFATVAEDTASLKVTLADDSTAKDGTYELALGPLVESVTVPKLTVTGLPAGLTYDAKTLKIGGTAKKPGKSVVKVQATNTSVKKATDATTGEFSLTVPNFESDKMPNLKYGADDYGVLHSGVAFDPGLVDCTLADGWTVKVSGLPTGLKWDAPNGVIAGVATAKADSYTVTFALSKGAAKETATITLNVEDLPAWAVGTFDGAAYAPGGDPVEGIVQALTVDAKGKIGGKILKNGESWALSAASFDDYDADSGEYYATVIAKNGTRVETNSIAVSEAGVEGLTLSLPASSWSAWQNLWKRADTKASQPVFKSNIVVDHYLGAAEDAGNLVKLTFQKDGVVKFAGKVGGASVSGTSQLVNDGKGWTVTLYAPPKAPFKGWCETFAVTLETENNVVTDVTVAAASAEPPPAWGVGEYIGYGQVVYPPATLGGISEYLWGLVYVDMNDDFSFTGRFVPVSGPGSPAPFSGKMYRVQVTEDIYGYLADDVAININGDDALLHFQFITMGFGKMGVGSTQCSPNVTGITFFDVVHNIWARDDFSETRPTFASGTTKSINLKNNPGIYSQAGKTYTAGDALTFVFGEDGKVAVTGKIFGSSVNSTATLGVEMEIEEGAKLECMAYFEANGRIYDFKCEIPSSGTVTADDIFLPDDYFGLINGD